MNQKIIKLVRQALNESVSTPVESIIASRIDDHGIVEIPNTFAEKFAELIVAECASIVYKTCQDGDAGAQAILYEFDIDNARSQK